MKERTSPLNFYHIGIYYTDTDAHEVAGEDFRVLYPQLCYYDDLPVLYDDIDENAKSKFQSLSNALKEALDWRANDYYGVEFMKTVPIIVLKEGKWYKIDNENEAVEIILQLA
jgi:hypothetical protein